MDGCIEGCLPGCILFLLILIPVSIVAFKFLVLPIMVFLKSKAGVILLDFAKRNRAAAKEEEKKRKAPPE